MALVRIAFLAMLMLHLAESAGAQTPLRARQFAEGFTVPVAFVQDPTDATVQFVVEQRGRIRVLRNGALQPTDFLDLQSVTLWSGERGLLGLAFPPDAASSGRFFVHFDNTAGNSVIARFRRSATNPLIGDPASRFDLSFNSSEGVLPFISQPFPNHKGGHLAFGPDGYLYIGMGDGGSGNDPNHFAQSRQSLLGKMLRVDVNVPDTHPIGFVIPADNPFNNGSALPEIWSFGWRNPWRWNFDDVSRGGTGAMVAADVGQNAWEEVNYEPRGRGGRNYGWRNREGAHDNVTSLPPAYLPLTEPIHEYGRNSGASITGGFVYRGSAMPAMRGRYFFGDFVSSRVWSIALAIQPNGEAQATDLREHTTELGGMNALSGVSSFGVDADGELYIVSYNRGVILKITSTVTPPTNLRIIR
jgi:glucose/arabinose dehydrogenase